MDIVERLALNYAKVMVHLVLKKIIMIEVLASGSRSMVEYLLDDRGVLPDAGGGNYYSQGNSLYYVAKQDIALSGNYC